MKENQSNSHLYLNTLWKKPEQSYGKPNEDETVKAETSSADGKFTIVQQATKAEIITTLQHAGVCSFSLNVGSFQVNSQKLGVQAPQNVEFE